MAYLADINVSEGSVATYARCGGIFFDIHSGLYLSNFIRGVEVLAIEVDDRANA